MMRGMREPAAGGHICLVCPSCGTRLAIEDLVRPGVLCWTDRWHVQPDGILRRGRHRSGRAKVGESPDPFGCYSHPEASIAVCPGCDERVEIT